MPLKNVQRKIDTIDILEQRALALAIRMDNMKLKWMKLRDQVKETPEWKERCAAKHFSTEYQFRDILC